MYLKMCLAKILTNLLLFVLCNGVYGDGHPNLGLLPAECGVIDGERMSDSKYARLYEFPWMAAISYFLPDGGLRFACSGTLINQRYVLLPGHCTKNSSRSNRLYRIRVGDYDTTNDVDCEGQGPTLLCEDQFQDIDIEEVILHESYSSNGPFSNDIALLRLKTPLDFNRKNIAPVCLPLTSELQNKTLPGLEAIVAGWELVVNGTTTSKLLKVKTPIKEYEECEKHLYRDAKYKEKTGICTGGAEALCPLLSGSPLMLPIAVKEDGYRYFQYGITNTGSRVCGTKQWTSYVDVTKYVEWILDKLKP